MNKFHVFIAIAIAIIFIITMFIGVLAFNGSSNGVNCNSMVRYDYVSDKDPSINESVINVGVLFYLDNGKGTISQSGTLDVKGKKYVIERYAEVSYTTKKPASYFIHTDKLNIHPNDNVPDELAKKYLYGYMVAVNGWLAVGIQPCGKNAFLISTTQIPQMFCRAL
ncbi:FidL-like protein [Serratia liquefaciens]|uniref:FidL-like protein n=2 Tax=Serratia liquefaciens TaxID=614 RepID=UPI00235EFCA3|nr:FidL-like protein [Serratia liquefaciens]